MKNQTNRVLIFTILLILSIISSNCERDWTNPLDDASGIDWSPLYLSSQPYSANQVLLSWSTSYSKVDSFLLDKQINDEPWIEKYASIAPDDRSFTDDSINTMANDYSYRIYAKLGDNFSDKKSVKYSLACGYDSIIDKRDGNRYSTILIGNQCWMGENLKFLPIVLPPASIESQLGRYFVYDYFDSIPSDARQTYNYQTYGVLYNWTAAKYACPEGWQLPDWEYLIQQSGGYNFAGKALKEPDTIHWQDPNDATGNLGFNALPGGKVNYSGQFMLLGYEAGFWDVYQDAILLYNNRDTVEKLQNPGSIALSVRCVMTDDQK